MIHWYWLLPAAIGGGVIGYIAAALMVVAKESQRDQDRMINERTAGNPPRDYADW